MTPKRVMVGVLLALSGFLIGCTTAENASVPGLLSRTVVSPDEGEIVVNGGGRSIRSLVLLPEGYAEGGDYPLLLAVHNFAANAAGFARLIHAWRLTKGGILVVLPEAAGLIPEWQGPGITITASVRQPNGEPVDDVAGIAETLAAVRHLYRIDPADINVAGFSQGATASLELARRLDRRQPGSVRRLFLVAGGLARPLKGGLLEGSDLIAYEPGRNGLQGIANFLTGEPAERRFMPEIIAAKGCVFAAHDVSDGIDLRRWHCRDGRKLTWIFEAKGEHAWPGQARRNDSWLMGRGSRSWIDFTDLILDEVEGGRAASPTR